jgi:TetR/AcrR family transcriptional repressor of mexJK operon
MVRRNAGPRADDPRVVRSRAAVAGAARQLFMRKGYAGTTMEEIAAVAGLTKRTLYNNYADKDALFRQIVAEAMEFAEAFARGLPQEFSVRIPAANLHAMLGDLAQRMALAIMRPEVVTLRRLLVGEARAFPTLGAEYFNRAPGRVLDALAAGFEHLGRIGLLRISDPRIAAAQFAYLIVGEALDRAMIVGTVASRDHVIRCAHEGVQTFLARYGTKRRGSRRTPA